MHDPDARDTIVSLLNARFHKGTDESSRFQSRRQSADDGPLIRACFRRVRRSRELHSLIGNIHQRRTAESRDPGRVSSTLLSGVRTRTPEGASDNIYNYGVVDPLTCYAFRTL